MLTTSQQSSEKCLSAFSLFSFFSFLFFIEISLKIKRCCSTWCPWISCGGWVQAWVQESRELLLQQLVDSGHCHQWLVAIHYTAISYTIQCLGLGFDALHYSISLYFFRLYLTSESVVHISAFCIFFKFFETCQTKLISKSSL